MSGGKREGAGRPPAPPASTRWAPLPGAQFQFLTCPIYEALMHGTRGGGKTDTLLMSFAQHTGKGFGQHWRGVLFRLTYPQLADVVAKSRRWFSQFFPRAKFNKSEYYWEWPDGEMLFFRYGSTEDDYWNYHGHEYCVAPDTPVLTPDGWVPIGSLRVGHSVVTLDGIQKVSKVFAPKMKECVRAYVYDDHQRLIGTQVQSIDHQLLTSEQTPHLLLSGLSQTDAQSRSCSWSWQGYKSLASSHPGIQGLSSSQADEESFGTGFQQTRQESAQLRLLSGHSAHLEHLLNQGASRPLESTRSRYLDILREQGQGLFQESEAMRPGLALPGGQFQSRMDRGASSELAYARVTSQVVQGSLSGCHPSGRSSDEQLHWAPEIAQGGAPLLGGVAAHARVGLLADALGSARTGRFCDEVGYVHPYSKQIEQTTRRVDGGWVVYESCGPSLTIDISVETSNHYVTKTGLINKNCWLGFEELTNWRDLSFYESMQSTCRSSVPGMPRMVRATCNPFGKGHGAVKERFKLGQGGVPSGQVIRLDGEKPRVAIRSTIYENKVLLANDPDYLATLEGLKDPNRRKAWLEGDWDIHVGSFLEGVWDAKKHIVDPFPIPSTWKVWKSMDWGYARPYAIYWMAMDPDGCIYIWRELYGIGEKPNEGSREDAAKVARIVRNIEEHDERLGYEYRLNLADPAIFSKIGADRSIGQIFREGGVKWLEAWNAKGSRVNGAQEIIRLLAEGKLKVFSTCKHWLRTVPSLPPSDDNPEDVDTDAEDHCFPADTLVMTNIGLRRIDSIGDALVLNDAGEWVPHENWRIIRRNAELVRVVFEDGTSVTCTPDHEFLTAGDKYLPAVDLADKISYARSITCKSQSSAKPSKSSTASGTTVAAITSSARACDCTGLCGNTSTAQCLTDITSTTRTRTGQTTSPRTLSAFLVRLMCRFTQKAKSIGAALRLASRPQKPGTSQMLGESGTGSTTSSTAPARCTQGQKSSVLCAESCSCQQGTGNSVTQIAGPKTSEKGIRVIRVEPAGRADVGCITVMQRHNFALANGAIVSNCWDATRYGVMRRRRTPDAEQISDDPEESTYKTDDGYLLRV